LWDPGLQPFGPKAVIDVRDMKEVEAMQLPPAMQGAITREQEIVQASERVAGINDVALGQAPDHQQTLGEVNLVAEQSFVRMDEVIKNLQEGLEELGQVRHAIWLNCIKEYGEAGMPMPAALQDQDVPGLDQRGGQVNTATLTPDLLDGTFRFKPRGSTETADPRSQRADFTTFAQFLPGFIQTMPMIAQLFGPNAVRSMLDQMVRVFRFPNRQAFLGNASQLLGAPQGQPQPMAPPSMGPASPLPLPPGPPA
jgi:hypothetical protein